VYFLVNCFLFINRIYIAVKPNNPSPTLWFLALMVLPQQGTGLAIIFLFSIRQNLRLARIKAAFYEWCHKTQIKEYPTENKDLETSYYPL